MASLPSPAETEWLSVLPQDDQTENNTYGGSKTTMSNSVSGIVVSYKANKTLKTVKKPALIKLPMYPIHIYSPKVCNLVLQQNT